MRFCSNLVGKNKFSKVLNGQFQKVRFIQTTKLVRNFIERTFSTIFKGLDILLLCFIHNILRNLSSRIMKFLCLTEILFKNA